MTTTFYCQKCNITYTPQTPSIDDEYVAICPCCELRERLRIQHKQLQEAAHKLRIYQICEECQSYEGYCDRERTGCPKLQHHLNSKS